MNLKCALNKKDTHQFSCGEQHIQWQIALHCITTWQMRNLEQSTHEFTWTSPTGDHNLSSEDTFNNNLTTCHFGQKVLLKSKYCDIHLELLLVSLHLLHSTLFDHPTGDYNLSTANIT